MAFNIVQNVENHSTSANSIPNLGNNPNSVNSYLNHSSITNSAVPNIGNNPSTGVNSYGHEFWMGEVKLVDSVHSSKYSNSSIAAQLSVNNESVMFQLDTGAQVNTIQNKYVHTDQIVSTSRILNFVNSFI